VITETPTSSPTVPRHRRATRAAAGLLAALGAFALHGAAAPPSADAAEPSEISPFVGAWEGSLTFRGEPLALRLEVGVRDGAPAVRVDFPQLVYHGQPADASLDGGALAVELPFGLGRHAFSARDGALTASAELAGDPLTIELRPAAPFEPERLELAFGAFDPPIEGTLVLPPGAQAAPLLLLTAGSGDPHRGNWSYASWGDRLARRGIASLVYDRRPDDELSADGRLFTLEDHARDLAAALDALAADPRLAGRLDLGRVGVLGKSRGAWIGLAAAAADPRIRLLAALAGAAVGVEEQDLQAIAARMRAADRPEDEIQGALAYARLYFHVAAHPDDWPRLAKAASEAADAPWAEYVRLPETVGDLDWFGAHLGFDPMPLLADLEIPVFYAWGENDRSTPPAMNRPLVAALLAAELAPLSRLEVYPDTGHSLEGPLNTDDDPETVWEGLSPRLLSDLDAWLAERGFLTDT